MMNNGYGIWMASGMGLLSLLFWVVVIAGVVLIVRWLTARDGPGLSSPPASALDILNRRYAKGEIDQETYLSMKRDIAAGDDAAKGAR